MTTTFTDHFRFGIPDFLTEPWHGIIQQTIRDIDNAIYGGILTNGVTMWTNSTAYAVGHAVFDPNDGSYWTCAVAHTSAAAPTTFAADRLANPTFWHSLFITKATELEARAGTNNEHFMTPQRTTEFLDERAPFVLPLQPVIPGEGIKFGHYIPWLDENVQFTGIGVYPFWVQSANPIIAGNAGSTVNNAINGATYSIRFTDPTLVGSPITITVVAGPTDTTTTLAAALVNAINANDVLSEPDSNLPIFAYHVSGNVFNIQWDCRLTLVTASVGTGSITLAGPVPQLDGVATILGRHIPGYTNMPSGSMMHVLEWSGQNQVGSPVHWGAIGCQAAISTPGAELGAFIISLGRAGNLAGRLYLRQGMAFYNESEALLTDQGAGSINAYRYFKENVEFGPGVSSSGIFVVSGQAIPAPAVRGIALFSDGVGTGELRAYNNVIGTLDILQLTGSLINITDGSGTSIRYSAGSFIPVTNNVTPLGSSANSWADLFLGNGGVINFNSGDVLITHQPDQLVFSGAAGGYFFSHTVMPLTDNAVALGNATTARWSDLFLGDGAVINFNNGNVTITHSANNLTTNMTGSITLNGGVQGASPTPRLVFAPYHDDAGAVSVSHIDLHSGVFGFGISGGRLNYITSIGSIHAFHTAADLTNPVLVIASGSIAPGAHDITSLGVAGQAFSDLHLAEGGLINWDSGDVTITQTGNVLSFSGASTRYEFSNTITPVAIDGAALGTTALQFSDLFLAEGGIINWDNGDVTITQTNNVLAFAGASSGYTFDAAPSITIASGSTTLVMTSQDAGATGPTAVFFHDSASPTVGDLAGQFIFQGRSSTGVQRQLASFNVTYITTTNAAEYAIMGFNTVVGGAQSVEFYCGNGLQVGNPTGGFQGTGTVNATAVYDDSVLLTCMGMEFLNTGAVDVAYWDSTVPDLVIPPIKDRDADGDEIIRPEKRVVRRHELAHEFKALIDDGFDPRNPTAYVNKMKADAALPGMPTKANWRQNQLSTGQVTNRLWLATEMLAVACSALLERIEAIEAELKP